MRYLSLTSRLMVGGFLLSFLYAQSVTVLATRGDVQVEQAGGAWVKATAGMKLSEQQKVRVGPQSYIALVFAGNKARELRQPGTYTLSQILTQKSSVDENPYASKYTGYVLNQAIASGAGRASGKTLGAVTRSTMAPLPRTPIQSTFFADRIHLYWDRVPGSEGYIVQILDENGQPLLSQEVSAEQTSVELNLENKVKPGPCYYWRVSTRRHPNLYSNNICFRVLPSDKASLLKKEEEALRRSLELKSAIDYAILGAFYEQNGLYGYAWQAYNQAASIEPNADGYITLRENLHQRIAQSGVSE
ncbi:MAG: hypothetical protein RMK19_07770 [Bacteroidia bacterium]|nr:hypothetical protein [Bacteroidia bacterium]MDW8015892.1 hypothetical protein [Bacteroidia bacterium]